MTKEKEFEFRDYIHECKESGILGSDDGDYNEQELDELAHDFLGLDQP